MAQLDNCRKLDHDITELMKNATLGRFPRTVFVTIMSFGAVYFTHARAHARTHTHTDTHTQIYSQIKR